MSWNDGPALFMDTGWGLVSRAGLSSKMVAGQNLPTPPGFKV